MEKFCKIPAPGFNKILKVFTKIKNSKNALSKLMYCFVDKGGLNRKMGFHASDGSVHLSASLDVEVKEISNELLTGVFSSELFHKVKSPQLEEIIITEVEGSLYLDFFGSAIVLNKYDYSPQAFCSDKITDVFIEHFDRERLLDLFKSLRPILELNESPGYAFLFFNDGVVYATNGISIASAAVPCGNPFTLRYRDVLILMTILETCRDTDSVSLYFGDKRIIAKTDNVCFEFPRATVMLHEEMKDLVNQAVSPKFAISTEFCHLLIDIVSKIPGNVDSVVLSDHSEKLKGTVRNKHRGVNSLNLSGSRSCLDLETEFQRCTISVKQLLAGLSFFSDSGNVPQTIDVGTEEYNFYMLSPDQQFCILT